MFRGLPGDRGGGGVSGAGRSGGFPRAVRGAVGADDLRPARRVTARWAVRAALPAARAEDFVIAVSEVAARCGRAMLTGPGAVVLPAPCATALSPGGRAGRQAAGCWQELDL